MQLGSSMATFTNHASKWFPPEDKPRLNAKCDIPPLPPHSSSTSTSLFRPQHEVGIMGSTSAGAAE
eukprot:8848539-Pyramimonas_sp.AAC.1